MGPTAFHTLVVFTLTGLGISLPVQTSLPGLGLDLHPFPTPESGPEPVAKPKPGFVDPAPPDLAVRHVAAGGQGSEFGWCMPNNGNCDPQQFPPPPLAKRGSGSATVFMADKGSVEKQLADDAPSTRPKREAFEGGAAVFARGLEPLEDPSTRPPGILRARRYGGSNTVFVAGNDDETQAERLQERSSSRKIYPKNDVKPRSGSNTVYAKVAGNGETGILRRSGPSVDFLAVKDVGKESSGMSVPGIERRHEGLSGGGGSSPSNLEPRDKAHGAGDLGVGL